MSHPRDAFLSSLDIRGLKVDPLEGLIFLCGGLTEKDSLPPISGRDCFLRYLKKELPEVSKNTHQAEDLTRGFREGLYPNLILLEKQIARLASVVVIVLEGPGAIAELGAFSQIPEIAEKLLVFVRQFYFERESFIRDGPIAHLEEEFPESIQVYHWQLQEGLAGDVPEISSIEAVLPDMVSELLRVLEKRPQSEKFDEKNEGHLMLLVADLLEYMHALNVTEIIESLSSLGISISQTQIKQYLYLLSKLGIVEPLPYGNSRYYASAAGQRFIHYSFKEGADNKNRERIQTDIIAFYEQNDDRRFRALKHRPRPPSSASH